ncbi:DUF4262 domain-containing protein [Pseudonocardia kujensis]|uniref:DUF4262 domain-containing protein n=1 Tax=Pseudonocardia kujensis TaxID=1128675 RepID=UPI001E3A4543|nr:DUF4262 domain-containing protein [Pseudonocardia kujensis]MCE0767284.1 DUF4262 domain-containing protein [Pseudonocardia kujensis]
MNPEIPSEIPSELVHRIDQYEAWQRETIRRHGWALQAVLGDEEGPPFVYTVGLSGFDHPELIVFAVDQATAARALNRLGEYVRLGGRLGPGDTVGLPEGLVSLLAFPDSADWLLGANRLYRMPGGPPVEALLVVPEEGYAEEAGEDLPCRFCG